MAKFGDAEAECHCNRHRNLQFLYAVQRNWLCIGRRLAAWQLLQLWRPRAVLFPSFISLSKSDVSLRIVAGVVLFGLVYTRGKFQFPSHLPFFAIVEDISFLLHPFIWSRLVALMLSRG